MLQHWDSTWREVDWMLNKSKYFAKINVDFVQKYHKSSTFQNYQQSTFSFFWELFWKWHLFGIYSSTGRIFMNFPYFYSCRIHQFLLNVDPNHLCYYHQYLAKVLVVLVIPKDAPQCYQVTGTLGYYFLVTICIPTIKIAHHKDCNVKVLLNLIVW